MRFLLLLILVSCLVETKVFAAGPVVHTPNGDVEGVDHGVVESFKGLPFAAPPLGDWRWKPPQDPDNWTDVRPASEFSLPCPQLDENGKVIGDENCLYLNVFRPKGAQGLPVMMFIHGGHNSIDSAGPLRKGEIAPYDGRDFAQNGNIVVVTINYRLGALGFIAHPKLSMESLSMKPPYHGSGNYGYMDQIKALQWVHNNIAAFGGNPNNITVFGLSNGGGGVLVMMTSRLTRDPLDPLTQKALFHKAIIHSGVFDSQSLADGEKTGYSLSKKINCLTDEHELKCLRDTPAETIVKAMGPGGRGLDPIIDGYVLDVLFGSPINVIRQGLHYRMPVLIGNVVEEVSWTHYDDSKDLHTEQAYKDKIKQDTIEQKYGAATLHHLLKLYPTSDYIDVTPDWVDEQGALRLRITPQPSPRQAYNAIKADRQFVCGARAVLQALSAHQSDFFGRFLYTHTFLGGLKGSSGFYGASHGFDLAFVFGKPAFDFLGLTPTPDELTLKAKVQKTWADFARWGSPGDFWDRYDPSRDNYVIFNTPMSSGSQLRKKQCDYWDLIPPPAFIPN
jgi:para-nitrobenzyl esterase